MRTLIIFIAGGRLAVEDMLVVEGRLATMDTLAEGRPAVDSQSAEDTLVEGRLTEGRLVAAGDTAAVGRLAAGRLVATGRIQAAGTAAQQADPSFAACLLCSIAPQAWLVLHRASTWI